MIDLIVFIVGPIIAWKLVFKPIHDWFDNYRGFKIVPKVQQPAEREEEPRDA